MKNEVFIEANKLDRKIERLNLDITRLEEFSAEEFNAYSSMSYIPTEISEPFRITCLECLRQHRDVLVEKFENL